MRPHRALAAAALCRPGQLRCSYDPVGRRSAGAFALDMRHLERESETGQLLQPRFAAARTIRVLTDFKDGRAAILAAGFLFAWRFIPETRGRTLEQIEAMMRKER